MLSTPYSASFGQVRAYSSDSKDAAGLEFGFQSLGSLFPAPPAPGRYSRPRERRAEDAASKESEEEASSAEEQKGRVEEKPYVQSALPEGGVSAGRRRERLPAKKSQASAKSRTITPARVERKIPNPFAKTKKVAPSEEAKTDTQPNAKAWGLSQEDQDTIDSISNPSASLNRFSEDEELAESAENITATPAGPRLTHVKSSGEAHMVDVGDKASTKRVAIAVAHIGLKKDVYDQIVDNSNKKGDVLGIARIAGIMAAKRTADIIPLCHPLAISKAEVDVRLVPFIPRHHKARHYWSQTCPRGALVAIQARVECVGPTGVEMEALMAVQGAALTVFDMCKAVDKTMTIQAARVVYKAGGRSGVSVEQSWKQHVGAESFTAKGELKDGADTSIKVPGETPVV
jgi:molybdenum cofactor biosynthesis enzyme